MEKFEAIVAAYGVPDSTGEVMSERAALQIFDQLQQQADHLAQSIIPGYRVTLVRIEGNRESGRVYATFEKAGKEV